MRGERLVRLLLSLFSFCVVYMCGVDMGGGFLCGMEHGVEKAMMMQGGACAAELRLIRVWFGFGWW